MWDLKESKSDQYYQRYDSDSQSIPIPLLGNVIGQSLLVPNQSMSHNKDLSNRMGSRSFKSAKESIIAIHYIQSGSKLCHNIQTKI